MSTNDNIAIVQRFYAAKGDPAIVSQVMSADAVWDLTPGFPGGGVYSGWSSVVGDFLAPLAAGFTSFAAEAETFTGDGDKVIAVGHYRGTAKTGTAFTARFVHIWTVTDGQITHNYQIADSAMVESHIQR